MITVLVAGGRTYRELDRVCLVLDQIHFERGVGRIIHGACGWDMGQGAGQWQTVNLRGADGCADTWARDRGVVVDRYPANWTALGRGAGPLRNEQMIRSGRVDLMVAFPGGAGTDSCKRLARRAGIPVLEV